jgi:hypothetical protein
MNEFETPHFQRPYLELWWSKCLNLGTSLKLWGRRTNFMLGLVWFEVLIIENIGHESSCLLTPNLLKIVSFETLISNLSNFPQILDFWWISWLFLIKLHTWNKFDLRNTILTKKIKSWLFNLSSWLFPNWIKPLIIWTIEPLMNGINGQSSTHRHLGTHRIPWNQVLLKKSEIKWLHHKP